MSPFALPLRTVNATALGNESAFRQETGAILPGEGLEVGRGRHQPISLHRQSI
jgi:hypothetical protein